MIAVELSPAEKEFESVVAAIVNSGEYLEIVSGGDGEYNCPAEQLA